MANQARSEQERPYFAKFHYILDSSIKLVTLGHRVSLLFEVCNCFALHTPLSTILI